MNDNTQFDGTADRQGKYSKLARWLQHVLATPQEKNQLFSTADDTNPFDSLLNSDYHPHFFQQLPDFIMALLENDPKAPVQYAPLLYHLAGCPACHTAYLELYEAMRSAVQAGEGEVRLGINRVTRPLATIPVGTLVHLSQLLITQAEAVLRQAQEEHRNADSLARSLLQLAMKISTDIQQSSMRSRALHDLVRVATLFESSNAPPEQGPVVRSYSPLIGAGSARKGKIMRRAETSSPFMGTSSAAQPAIFLRSSSFEGIITQHEDTLELHLQDLDETLQGQFVLISVPLGSLIEPVHWVGGNPHTIRSVTPVDEHGTLNTPLGQTTLRLNHPDERDLLEVMFLLLEVRRHN